MSAITRNNNYDLHVEIRAKELLVQALFLEETERSEEAIERYTKALYCRSRKADLNREILWLRGRLYARQDLFERAFSDLTKALVDYESDRDPLRAKILVERAAIYLQKREAENCRRDLMEAFTCDPGNIPFVTEILHRRSALLRDVGRMEDAMDDLKVIEALSNGKG